MSVELNEVFSNAEQIKVYIDGETACYTSETQEYEKILDGFLSLINGAHEMPAYGVSLNNETLRAINNGVWLEFIFEEQYESSGMPFEKLLINVGKEFYGFNLIRYCSGFGYDGRCFYYDLVNKNMNSLYNLLTDLKK